MGRLQMKRALIGFAAGATIPAATGVYLLIHELAYRASLPRLPNAAFCGMGMLGAYVLIFLVAPLTGAFGGVIAEILRRR